MTNFTPITNLETNKAIIIDTTAPTLTEITPITTPTADTTPNYTFNTNEAGAISYGGSCASATTDATSGNNTITLNSLTNDTYTDCTITVTDTAGNASDALSITSFTIASAGITLTESNSSTAIEEGSTTDTYTIVLDTTPTNDVVITITPDAQSTTNSSTITFTSSNWETEQTITITATDDTNIESDHTSTIIHTSASDDANYDGASISSVVANITDNDFSGGGLPAGFSNPPSIPTSTPDNPKGEFSVLINEGDKYTNNLTVNLKLYAGNDTNRMSISNDPTFINASIIPYEEEVEWDLSKNPPCPLCQRGNNYIVYAKFYTQYGVASEIVSDSIIVFLDPPEIELTQAKDSYFTNEEVIISGITKSESIISYYLNGELLNNELQSDKDGNWTINLGEMKAGTFKIRIISEDLAGNFSNPLELSFLVEEIIVEEVIKEEVILPSEKPGATLPEEIDQEEFLIPQDEDIQVEDPKIEDSQEEIPETEIPQISEEEQNPLKPIKEIISLSSFNNLKNWTEKFDSIKKSLGQTEIVDLIKENQLSKITFNLPGFSEIKEEDQSNEIPTEVIFARVANKQIDLNSILSFNEEGEIEQKINIITNTSLSLAIKPEYPVDNIKGYFVFKGESKKAENKEDDSNLSFKSFLQEIFKEALAQEDKKETTETERLLVLAEFEYFDSDNDGIYTADVNSPKTKGEYEIVTVIDYQDETLGSKNIKLVTIIDPEGYVYEKNEDKETRIPGAVISIYKLNSESNKYELWQAGDYDQRNPQTTDNTGKYSFLVPKGTYYLTVEAPNYTSYQSEPFTVQEGTGIHKNIELKSNFKKSIFAYWKYLSLLLIIAVLLIVIIIILKKRKNI